MIAVRGVKSQVTEEIQSDNEDDEDEKENETTSNANAMDPTVDHIGYVQQEFKEISTYHAPTDKFEILFEEEKDNEESGDEIIFRALGQRYNDFRTVLSEGDTGKDSQSKPLGKSKTSIKVLIHSKVE